MGIRYDWNTESRAMSSGNIMDSKLALDRPELISSPIFYRNDQLMCTPFQRSAWITITPPRIFVINDCYAHSIQLNGNICFSNATLLVDDTTGNPWLIRMKNAPFPRC